MKLTEIYREANALAPFSLSREYCEKYDAYDNSGILLDCGNEISCVLFSLDCSMRAVGAAKKIGAELLFTHHPAIYAPVKALSAENPLTECAKAGISVLSAHLNLDCAVGGIDDSLAAALGAKETISRMHPLSCGGYGSVFLISQIPLSEFADKAKRALNTERTIVYGDRPAEKIASFCGAGLDEESVSFASSEGADTIVSSDPKHHLIASAIEKGMNVVLLTHYAAENYGFHKFYQKIKEKLTGVRTEYFTDDRLL